MSDGVGEASRGSAVWGQRWLEAIENDPAFDDNLLSVGARVARVHAGSDIQVSPGRAEVSVASGPRRRYHVEVRMPVFGADGWARLLDQVAASPSRAAALAEGVVEPTLDDDLRRLGFSLLPTPGEVTTECDCAGWGDNCKHAAGALVTLADAIDEDPLLLLALRGLHRDDLTAGLEARSSTNSSVSTEELASQAWLRSPRTATVATVAVPAAPAATPTWGAPPSTAPFSADGLELIGTDLIARAWAMVQTSEASSQLDLDPLSDLARLASMFASPAQRRQLAEHSGVPARELGLRALAWERAGADGVRTHVNPNRTTRVAPDAQLRQIERVDGPRWYRFEKVGGRWTLVAGPAESAEVLLSAEPIGSAEDAEAE